jgi:hypothetical protein
MMKKIIALNLDDLLLCCGIPAGLFLLIHLITAGVLAFFHPQTSLLISGALLPFVAGILILCVSVAHTGHSFFHALRFSQTRHRALCLVLGLIAFESVCSLGIIALLTALEHLAAPKLWMALTGSRYLVWGIDGFQVPEPGLAPPTSYPQEATLFVEDFSLDWWWFPLLLLAGMAIGIILSAISSRFGRRGSQILWVIWFAFCILPQAIPDSFSISQNGLLAMAVAGGLFTAAALVWSLHYLLHAPVKN